MDAKLTTAIVSAGATALVAIVALILNSKRFDDMGKRISASKNNSTLFGLT